MIQFLAEAPVWDNYGTLFVCLILVTILGVITGSLMGR